MFIINHVLKFKYPPWLDKGYDRQGQMYLGSAQCQRTPVGLLTSYL